MESKHVNATKESESWRSNPGRQVKISKTIYSLNPRNNLPARV